MSDRRGSGHAGVDALFTECLALSDEKKLVTNFTMHLAERCVLRSAGAGFAAKSLASAIAAPSELESASGCGGAGKRRIGKVSLVVNAESNDTTQWSEARHVGLYCERLVWLAVPAALFFSDRSFPTSRRPATFSPAGVIDSAQSFLAEVSRANREHDARNRLCCAIALGRFARWP